ncbi:hypothetical protein Q6670_004108 [Salmonella enterica]|nr:hypothetical protein [Salmonella enterica]
MLKLIAAAILAMAASAPASPMVLNQSELECVHAPGEVEDAFNAVTAVTVEDGEVDRSLTINGTVYHATSANAENDGKRLIWYFPDGEAIWAYVAEQDEEQSQFVVYVAEDRLYTKVWQCEGSRWEPNVARIE